MKRVPVETPKPLEPKAPVKKTEGLSIPYDSVNEQILIIAACFDRDVRKGLCQRIRPDLFILEKHQTIWQGLTELSRKDLDYDPASLHQITGGKADVEYLQSLLSSRTDIPPNLKYHAEMLLWDRARVDCANGPLSGFLKIFQDPLSSPDKVKAASKAVVTALESNAFKHRAEDPRLLKEASNAVLGVFRGESYPYNLPGLDKYESGMRRVNPGCMPRQTTVVTAVSGGGKSLFLAHLALAQGPGIQALGLEGLGRKVLYGAWEMPPDMMLNLLAALYLGLDRSRMFSGLLTAEEEKALGDTKDLIQSYIKFKGQPKGMRSKGQHNEEALDDIYGMVADNGVDVAIFDLWERAFSFRYEYEEKACLVRQQEIAKELNVHQILAAQQRLKDVEMREDKRPTREGIKGSSAWVDIADTIIGCNLPHLWKSIPADTFEAILLKQRYGKWPLLVRADYDENSGLISGFQSAEYVKKPGTEVDEFLKRS